MADEPTDYSGEHTTVLDRSQVTGREAAVEAALGIARMAGRELVIFSEALADEVFADPAFLELVRQLAISSPHAQVRVLVASPAAASRNASQLLALIRQLSSHMAIRGLAPQHRNRTITYIVADDRALIYQPSPESSSFIVEKVPGTARHYLNQFEEMWESGSADADLRRANL